MPTSTTPHRAAASVLPLLLLLIAALPLSAQPAEPPRLVPEEPVVTVSGSGEVRAEPDEATVNLGVTAQAETAGEAQAEASRIAGRILEAVRGLGIEEKAVQTSNLSLFPVYADRSPRTPQEEYREPEIVAYRASNVVSVRLSDLGGIGPVIDAAVGAGANEVQGVGFQLRDDTAQRSEALTRAVASGRVKAEALAAALGMRLGPVLRAEEAGVSLEVPRWSRGDMAALRMESAASTPVSPGEITVTAGVHLLYRLLPAGG
jgi:uncharacterized protein